MCWQQYPRKIVCVSRVHGWTLAAVISAATVVFAPAAGADPGSPSYNQGKQAVDDQVLNRHVQLTPGTDLYQYCDRLRANVLKTGSMARVDSPPDFIAGCQDEGNALIASH
jgi:hypothetical protein